MYRLIVMDVDMPIINGWEATTELKRMEMRGELDCLCPITAHTAFNNDLDRQK
jgi:CheY-like chemotaxis protein